ncbi:Fatty acid hydroxylase superfamily protein [Roseovarius albus]|uniref:Fatty acid hydroxylase superfamily protein n=1 Tax=Roseovarius albus TaxID=1247867 RepID=A0A1X6Z9K6_9RHOB|nr:sterol desaturase family protein [Roseovarius albus]SLN44567.1 Fatty acid hydroxylase superfamily protein [Roseovarius albus]
MTRLKMLIHHNSIPVMLCAVAIGVGLLLWHGPVWAWGFVLLGIPAQMLNEYGLHRYIFHLDPPRQQWAFNLLYQAHYGHHDFPTNTRLFFAPIWVSVPMLVLNFALVWGVLSLIVPAYALPIAAAIVLVGGVSTFLGYEWFHMTAHLNVRKTRVERHVTTLHNQHHFRDFSKWFHVSPGGEIIDRTMGTAINRDSLRNQQRIEFIRTLGMRPDDPRLIKARHHYADKYRLSANEIERAARA